MHNLEVINEHKRGFVTVQGNSLSFLVCNRIAYTKFVFLHLVINKCSYLSIPFGMFLRSIAKFSQGTQLTGILA